MRRKRRWLWVSVLLALLVAGPFLPWAYLLAAGLARGEHFYHGLPSSYWSVVIQRRDRDLRLWHLPWSTRWLNWLQNYVGQGNEPAVVKDDPAAALVLVDLLRDKDPRVQDRAALLLGRYHQGERLVPPLVLLLGEADARRRCAGCYVLMELGSAAKAAVPALVQALKDKDPQVRWLAVVALGSIGPDAEPAAPVLVQFLGDRDEELRTAAAASLRSIQARAGVMVPALAAVVNRPTCSEEQFQWAARALVHDFGPEGVRVLAAALPDLESKRCVRVLRWLDAWKEQAGPAVPVIVRLAEGTDPSVRSAASEVLRHIDPQAAKEAGIE
jgi:HEAT repeat protein